MSKRAEKRALEAYPDDMGTLQEVKYILRMGFVKGYEQAEKDTIERVCEWLSRHYDIDLVRFRKAVLEEE